MVSALWPGSLAGLYWLIDSSNSIIRRDLVYEMLLFLYRLDVCYSPVTPVHVSWWVLIFFFETGMILLQFLDLVDVWPEVVTTLIFCGCCVSLVSIFFLSACTAVVFDAAWVMAVWPAVTSHVVRPIEWVWGIACVYVACSGWYILLVGHALGKCCKCVCECLIWAVIARIWASFVLVFLLMFAAHSLWCLFPAAAALPIYWLYFCCLLPMSAAMLVLLLTCFADVPPLCCMYVLITSCSKYDFALM